MNIFTIVSAISFLLLAISIYLGINMKAYAICVIACMLHGGSRAFSESVLLGLFKFFPADAVNIYSSGTGFSFFFSILLIMIY